MDLSSFSLNNADLLQQIGTLLWINSGETEMLKNLTTARVGYELWSRFTGEREVEALRNQTIINISKYIKENPKATKEQLTKEVSKQIWLFSQKIENM